MNIDWTKLITKSMKYEAALAETLSQAKAEFSLRNARAAEVIAEIQDRSETIGYGIDSGEASDEDVAGLAALVLSAKAWKAYKFQIGKVSTQPGWPTSPAWPVAPPEPQTIVDVALPPAIDS